MFKKNGKIYVKRKSSDANAAFDFLRDNEQTVCEADSKHEVRVCEWEKDTRRENQAMQKAAFGFLRDNEQT